MARENGILDITLDVSGNNLSGSTDDFIFVKVAAAGNKVVAAAANDSAIGISQETAKDGEGISFRTVGVSKLRLGGTVSPNQFLKPDASGNGVRHLGNSPASAKAIEGGVSGDIISVLIVHTAAST